MQPRWRTTVVAVAGVVVAYILVAMSPIPRAIARDHPEAASFFRPPLFNFSADYEDGAVLGFRVGSSREELMRTLVADYAETGTLAAACGRESGARPLTVAESYVAPSYDEGASAIAQRDVVCLHIPARKMVLIFPISNERVCAIQLTLVRAELP